MPFLRKESTKFPRGLPVLSERSDNLSLVSLVIDTSSLAVSIFISLAL